MRLDLPLQRLDLLVEGDQHRDRGAGGGRVGGGDHLGSAQLLAAQRGLDRAVLVSMSRRRAFLSAALIWLRRQPRRRRRVGGFAEQFESVGGVEVPRRPPARPGSTPAARAAAAECGGCVPRSTSGVPGQRPSPPRRPRCRRRPGAAGGRRCAPCRPRCARRRCRSWRPRRHAVPDNEPPATGSPRTPCTRPRPAPATHGPRSVSMPTSTSASSSSRCSPISACNRAIPATPSGSRALASLPPGRSITSTS